MRTKTYTVTVITAGAHEHRTYNLEAEDAQKAFDIAHCRYSGAIVKMTYLTRFGKTIELVIPRSKKVFHK